MPLARHLRRALPDPLCCLQPPFVTHSTLPHPHPPPLLPLPAPSARPQETVSTLHFADRAKSVMTRVQANTIVDDRELLVR